MYITLYFMSGAHGVAVCVCRTGAAGCLWIGGCSTVVAPRGFGAVMFGNTAELGGQGFQ